MLIIEFALCDVTPVANDTGQLSWRAIAVLQTLYNSTEC